MLIKSRTAINDRLECIEATLFALADSQTMVDRGEG